MTFQPPPPPPPPPGGPPPPPPPPGGPPPPPPPPPGGGYGPPPPAAGGAFDPKSVNPLDWAILGVGLLTLIFSFFGFYSGKVAGAGVSQSKSYSAWHDIFGGGFFGWIGMILAVLGSAALAIGLFAPQVHLPMPARALAFEGFALGFICEVLAIFIHPKFYHSSQAEFGFTLKIDFGHGFSFWIILILTAAGTVLALMRAQQTGSKLPGPMGSLPKIGG
jgi:hypothetical protein